MKKVICTLLFMAAISFAAEIQILPPKGADFAPDAPDIVTSIVRAAVSQTGNTPVETESEEQMKTSLMTMGNFIVVVCEHVSDGSVVGSGKQKAISVDDLDVAIENAAKQALTAPLEENSESEESDFKEEKNENFAYKRPTRNYVSYGLGVSLWHNYDFVDSEDGKEDMSFEQAFMLHYARIFEVAPRGAITIEDNLNFSFGEGWEIHETFLIGGRFFFSTGVVTPYVGAGLGLGIQWDSHYEDIDEAFAVGLATNAELGIICFRNSAMQLELGLAWDVLWDGFDDFERRFGAGSVYIAVNF